MPVTSSSSVVIRFPGGWGHVEPENGLKALDAAAFAVAARLASLHVDALSESGIARSKHGCADVHGLAHL